MSKVTNELNLKEVAKTILTKFNIPILKEGHYVNPSSKDPIATEKSQNLVSLRMDPMGTNFQNIPFPLNTTDRGNNYVDLNFIGINGEIVETVSHLNLSKYTNADYNKEVKNFSFKKNESIVVAVEYILTEPNCKSRNLLFLSKPYTLGEINKLRESYFQKKLDSSLKQKLPLIETIWK